MFEKITSDDRRGKGVSGLPDTPALETSEMQARFDSLPNLVIDKFNEFIDDINANTAALNIGAQVPSGYSAQENVQSILNAMVSDIKLNKENRHSHANKTALDTITQESLDKYTNIALMLDNILSVLPMVTNDNTAIPTSGAVYNFVRDFDYKQIVLRAAYPVGSVYSSRGVSPSVVLGGTWEVIDTDSKNVTRYVRVS